MNKMNRSLALRYFSVTLFLLLLSGCIERPETCPKPVYADQFGAELYPEDDHAPFQYPLDDPDAYKNPIMTDFAAHGMRKEDVHEFHAAEDYYGPPGTPVYAMADGEVSFSGPMGGYGWLVIVDHPQADLYSLYGHLSPSRWYHEGGPVVKGELVGYLGDDDENGGTAENPLVPHLHFGIRAGQRSDYPGRGDWRWMAGWFRRCPQDLGWLQPSVVIASQEIPDRGYPSFKMPFLEVWSVEMVLTSVYLIGAITLSVNGWKKKNPLMPLFGALFLGVTGWIFGKKGFQLSIAVFIMAAMLLGFGIFMILRRIRSKRQTSENEIDAAQP